MATFDEFYISLDPDSGIRGKQFEKFVKWFLKTDPVWKSQVEEIWLWDEHPNRSEWGPDCGIDLVFNDHKKKTWAVQAKCVSPERSIKKEDMDSFIAESSDSRFQGRLLIGSTDRIGSNADRVLNRHEVVRFLLEDFRTSQIIFPESPKNLSSGRRKDLRTPFTHQKKAIAEVVEGLKTANRGQVLMACGTGKTLTSLWIKERLRAKQVLVLLPSLSLLSQTLKEWNATASEPFKWICVCSDKSVAKKDKTEDDWITNTSEIGVPVTSGIEDIKYFLKEEGSKIIFSTYQSSPLIVQAQEDKATPAFDVVFADEAHRCTGNASDAFGSVLDEERIRTKKRLFFTATPRVLSNRIKKQAKVNNIEIASMDNSSLFGKVLHELKFSEAIEKDLLSDYQVIVVGVDDPMIQQKIINRDLLITDGKIIDAERLASSIAVAKSIKDYKLRRLITFHGRVKGAKQFAEEFVEIVKWIPEQSRPEGIINCEYVSGVMKSSERNEKIQRLKKISQEERRILSNARCLSEGVDVPTLDGIAFIDPKRSQVDIIQAVGRAIRKSDNKSVGTIILPVYLADVENTEDEVLASRFSDIWQIILALKSQDDSLMETIDHLRISLGSQEIGGEKRTGLEKIIFDLPERVSASFCNSIQTLVIQNTSDDWYERFGELKKFLKNNNFNFPAHDEEHGSWVNNQRMRYKRNNLIQEKIDLLLSLDGWVWDLLDNRWESKYLELQEYLKNNNGKLPTQDGRTYSALSQWVSRQRQSKNRDSLSDEKVKLLEKIPEWEWEPFDERWEKKYKQLVKYHRENNNKFPPARFPIIGAFAARMRKEYKAEILSEDKIQLLEKLSGWSWDPIEDNWNNIFYNLESYLEENNFILPQTIDKTFGEWINTQRRSKKEGTISKDHSSRLSNLKGWVWSER